ncbi:ribonuclease HII [Helicobacter sp. 11S02596-1]|uniref:ribonuclease HII n=1 Tax=Helicobacter sp. 11S02596-1 TaxID=1476194 RepID=UPI000BA6635F|nr:ribonuclease HII [Helicobacter sp. 11S02596-1]PAF44006.1 ribonuclease HII [Helicobacter sp. 11S02596-1]
MICGIDEAGRGSLCGSMFIAGVACDEDRARWLRAMGVKDSKKLSKPKRFELASMLGGCEDVHIHVVEKTCEQIDSCGLSACLKEAMREIIEHLLAFSRDFYMDGNTLFGLRSDSAYRLECLVKGDDKVPQISAASIIAKTSKDTQMLELHSLYPQYGFENNAGYGTKSHLEAINLYGYTPFHRKSFLIHQRAKASLFG